MDLAEFRVDVGHMQSLTRFGYLAMAFVGLGGSLSLQYQESIIAIS